MDKTWVGNGNVWFETGREVNTGLGVGDYNLIDKDTIAVKSTTPGIKQIPNWTKLIKKFNTK